MQRVELAVVEVDGGDAPGVGRARVERLHVAVVVAGQQRAPVGAAVERTELRVGARGCAGNNSKFNSPQVSC